MFRSGLAVEGTTSIKTANELHLIIYLCLIYKHINFACAYPTLHKRANLFNGPYIWLYVREQWNNDGSWNQVS